jgi:hypothetical protein
MFLPSFAGSPSTALSLHFILNMVENPALFPGGLLWLFVLPLVTSFSLPPNFLLRSNPSNASEVKVSSSWWSLFSQILSFFPSYSSHHWSCSDTVLLCLLSAMCFYLLVLFGRFVLSYSMKIFINHAQLFIPPSSSVCSVSDQRTVDLDEISWPQFMVDGDISFSEFVQRFEGIFEGLHIDPSKKFVCFRRCLSRLDPMLVYNSEALDKQDFNSAVERLGPLLSVSNDRREARIDSQYAAIQ